MAMNVGGAITPAINHTERVLFKPFAMRKWLALGYAMTCAMQPFMVFRRTFALVVLGQADPRLATVPGTISQGWTGIG